VTLAFSVDAVSVSPFCARASDVRKGRATAGEQCLEERVVSRELRGEGVSTRERW
jgi:hypothetical protein